MTYQTTNPHAQVHPLRSISLLRPVSVLGQAFAAAHADPVAVARTVIARKLELARIEIERAAGAYTDAKAAMGEANRMRRKDRHDRAIFSDAQVKRRIGGAFGVMNRMRGRLLRARKALAAAETAVAAVALAH